MPPHEPESQMEGAPKQIVQRFEQERQALALMDHEGIAKVFDCGTSERGQPYFVMELVKGIPLDQFCEQQRLSLRDRLLLMRQVCAAVQHAHQKGVVHRDLKPSNVLVSDDGGRLQVKIIDFGLAKAMGQRLTEASFFTEAGQVLGTLEYMAPEQADPTNQGIDARADIYSLGVMLYQVLVGALPFPGAELRRAGLLEMQRILREVEPPRPSTKLHSIGEAGAEIARTRGIGLAELKRVLRRDLDWVTLKALEKERNRRYETASALGEDLQRFLDHEPLAAGPPGVGYRLRKLARRHRTRILNLLVLVVGLTGLQYGFSVELMPQPPVAPAGTARPAGTGATNPVGCFLGLAMVASLITSFLALVWSRQAACHPAGRLGARFLAGGWIAMAAAFAFILSNAAKFIRRETVTAASLAMAILPSALAYSLFLLGMYHGVVALRRIQSGPGQETAMRQARLVVVAGILLFTSLVANYFGPRS
ncbi:MAG TPA: serine/threonine-protein kinase [Planctomycetota bacterium]|nr:serine/threonine-protein kinase [Planctomycetota bacterium]